MQLIYQVMKKKMTKMKRIQKMKMKNSLFLMAIYPKKKNMTTMGVFYLKLKAKLNIYKEVEVNKPILITQLNSNIQSNKAFLFCLEKYKKGKDSNLDEFIENFKVYQISTEGSL